MEFTHSALRTQRRECLIRGSVHLASLFCVTAFAQNAPEEQVCEDFGSYRHIRIAEPRAPNGTLRKDNITDEEVREVQRAALEVYPDSIVNISAVTDACDCEDGSNCTAQVWLALYRENITRSLVLSKIDGHWRIGTVQSWWLQYNAHQRNSPGFGRGAKQIAWQQENQRLLDSFPTCPTPPADWMLLRSENNSSTCVDMTSIQVSGSIRHAIFKHTYPHPKPAFGTHEKYSIDVVAFDCKDHRRRVDGMDTYSDDGTVRKYPGDDPVRWLPIRHDSVSAADFDLVCGWSAKK
jgi:hypothetical protein